MKIFARGLIAAADGLSKAKIKLYQVKSAEEKEAAQTILEARKIDLQEARNSLLETQLEQRDPTELAAIQTQAKLDEQSKLLELVDADINNGIPKAEAYQRRGLTYTAPTDPIAEEKALDAYADEYARREVDRALGIDDSVGGEALKPGEEGPPTPKVQRPLDYEDRVAAVKLGKIREMQGKEPIKPDAPTADVIEQRKKENEKKDILQQIERYTEGEDPDTTIAQLRRDEKDKYAEYQELAVRAGVESQPTETAGQKVTGEWQAQLSNARTFATEYNEGRPPEQHIDEWEAGERLKYFDADSGSKLDIFAENIENANKLAEQYFSGAKLTPAQIAEFALTGKFSDNNDDSFGNLVEWFKNDIEANPGRYGENPNSAALAWDSANRGKQWSEMMAQESAGRVFNVTGVITDDIRKQFPNQSDGQILDIMESAAQGALEFVTTTKSKSIASRWQANYDGIRGRILRLMRDPNIPIERKMHLVTEKFLQESFESSAESTDQEQFDGLQEVAGSVLQIEELFLELAQKDGFTPGNRKDIVDRVNRVFGTQLDPAATEIHQLVMAVIERHRLRVTGKAFRAGEQAELLKRFAGIGNNMQTNLAIIRGWLQAVNTLNKGVFKSRLSSQFMELAPDWYVLGKLEGEVRVEDGKRIQKYNPSYRRGDPEHDKDVQEGYKRIGKQGATTKEGTEAEVVKKGAPAGAAEPTGAAPTVEAGEYAELVRSASDGTPEDMVATIGAISERLPEEQRQEMVGQIAEQLIGEMDDATRQQFLDTARTWLQSLDMPDDQKQQIWERLNQNSRE